MPNPDSGCNSCDSWPGSPSYPCPIPQIADGDAVSASIANAPLSDLSSRTEYLRCFLESLEVGTAHYVRNVVFHTEVALGDVVYYEASSSSYRKAFVHIDGRDVYDNESCDTYTLDSSIADSSYAFGVVVEKGTDNVVCINGQFSTKLYDSGGATLIPNLLVGYTSSMTEASKTGQMYLSTASADAGKVTKTKPQLGVPVCFITPDPDNTGHYLVHVRTNLHDLMQAHRHYSFRLTNEPAVNFPIGYGVAAISDGDSGWTADTTELAIYLYEYTDNTCTSGLSTTLTLVGTATYAGNDSTYGGMIHSFKGNADYVRMIGESDACSGSDTVFESFLKTWDRGGVAVENTASPDPTDTPAITIFDDSVDNDALTTLESNSASPVYRVTNSTTTVTSYKINDNFQNTNLPGWLYCDGIACSSGGPGQGAKFYYNVDGDSTLSAVWPPYPVQSSILYISGVAPHTSQIVIDNEGIFWFDSTEDGAPFSHRFPEVNSPEGGEWGTDFNGKVLHKEALLYYTILASKTDDASVQTLTPKEGSVITLTDENGEDATTGRLVIGAEFTIDADGDTAGASVVKDFDGFTLKKGNVVEQIKSGPLIDVSSTITGGQGVVTISMADFDGVREGEPDMFFADDVLLERYSDIFYKVFPAGRTSSLTGKVFVPTFLPTGNSETYNLDIFIQFMSPGGDGLNLGNIDADYKILDTIRGTTYSGSTGNISTQVTLFATNTLTLGTFTNQYDYIVKSPLSAAVAVTPGDLFIFKLTRDSTSTSDPKVAILDVRYQISKT